MSCWPDNKITTAATNGYALAGSIPDDLLVNICHAEPSGQEALLSLVLSRMSRARVGLLRIGYDSERCVTPAPGGCALYAFR